MDDLICFLKTGSLILEKGKIQYGKTLETTKHAFIST